MTVGAAGSRGVCLDKPPNPSITYKKEGQLDLTDDEKRRIQEEIAKVKPEAEARVRAEFHGKYGRVGDALLNSRFKVLRDLALNVVSLYEMLVDPDYTIGWKTKAGIIFALGYFISPVDAIPDVVPVAGYLDDALVVIFVVHLLSGDIVKYREFRQNARRPLPSA